MSRRLITVVIASGLLAAPLGPAAVAFNQDPPQARQGDTAAVAAADEAFIKRAAEGGMKEVQVGQLAQARASDSNVKAFAERMVKDHGASNEELMSLAKTKGVTLPPPVKMTTDATRNPDPSVPGAAEPGARGTSGASNPLAALTGAEFDRAYMNQMVGDHEKTVQLFEQESTSGQDAEVKAWAAKKLPTVREHLTQARSIRDRLAASK
jgi:putative membrane protein